jgi:hypothetical protein
MHFRINSYLVKQTGIPKRTVKFSGQDRLKVDRLFAADAGATPGGVELGELAGEP